MSKSIEFLMSVPPYNPGDGAHFSDEVAAAYVAKGLARYFPEPPTVTVAVEPLVRTLSKTVPTNLIQK